jgi:hypothetical protein
MSENDGYKKYQGKKGVGALRQAVSRIRKGQGALREPLLLEYLLKEVSWDPSSLFGTAKDQIGEPRFSTTDLAKQVANYVVGIQREEERRRNPPDNLPGGPKKQLMALIPIAQMIIGFSRNYASSGATVLQSVHLWITPNWHRVVRKPGDKLAADERLWVRVLSTPADRRGNEYETMGLALVAVYAAHVLNRIYQAIKKLSRSTSMKQRFELDFEDDEDSFEAGLADIIEVLETVVDRIVQRNTPTSAEDRRAISESVRLVSHCLEGLGWWSWHLESPIQADMVDQTRSWLRYVLLHEKVAAFRFVQTIRISKVLSQSLQGARDVLQLFCAGDQVAIHAHFEPTAVQSSAARASQFENGFDPLFLGSTIEGLIGSGVLAVTDSESWQETINRCRRGQSNPYGPWLRICQNAKYPDFQNLSGLWPLPQ